MDRFYCVDEDGQLQEFDTEKEAREYAEGSLEYCRDASVDGWPEMTECIEYGRLVPIATCVATECETDEDGRCIQDFSIVKVDP